MSASLNETFIKLLIACERGEGILTYMFTYISLFFFAFSVLHCVFHQCGNTKKYFRRNTLNDIR